MKKLSMMVAVAFAVAAASAAPAAAQGKSGEHGHGNPHEQRTEVVREHGHGNPHEQRVETVRENGTATVVTHKHGVTTTHTRVRSATRSVPPGWCQGRGNPHNTAANCGYRTDRIYRDRNGVWRDRYGNRLRQGYVYRDRTGTVRDWLGRLFR